MTALLCPSNEVPDAGWSRWAGLAGAGSPRLDPTRRVDGLPQALARSFAAIIPEWAAMARGLAADPSAGLAHAPTCGGNVSDLGVMLAWVGLVDQWASGSDVVLCLCDDPWLFRHLADRPGVRAGTPPPLWQKELRLVARGIGARLRVAVRMAAAAWRCRAHRRLIATGAKILMVYGHPASTASGDDAYFGSLPREMADLKRVLHVDCPTGRARDLAAHGGCAALHAWGSPWAALGLVGRRWRPSPPHGRNWLVRRAAMLEGATGTPAMIAWQIHCQRRFLAAIRPEVAAWPWENHAWERDFVRAAKDGGCRTIGYQHATIGTLEANYGPASLPDGTAALPDVIACAGPVSRDVLIEQAIPADRLWLAGAWRFPPISPLQFSAQGPVFLPLPAHAAAAWELLEAARGLVAKGYRFLVREHPLAPVGFSPMAGLDRSPGPLAALGSARAVVFCGSSVGLEAVLAGLPTIRFLPEAVLANDVIPPGWDVPAATAAQLEEALAHLRPPVPRTAESLFGPVDPAAWIRKLRGER